MERSERSLKREEERNSEKTKQFKDDIEKFLILTDASDEISYHLRKDLGVMTNMPYYKEYKGIRNRMDRKEIILNYVSLLIKYDNPQFTSFLINKLSLNQLQTLRKLSKRPIEEIKRCREIGPSNGIWEHPIPINYIKRELIKFINNKKYDEIEGFLDYIIDEVSQIFLTKEEDSIVNTNYKKDMPLGWDWKTGNIYQRYKDVGVREDLYS